MLVQLLETHSSHVVSLSSISYLHHINPR